MKFFILAQGKGSRWQGKDIPCEYKQMLKIGDTPNLLRTLNMLEGQDVTVVSWDRLSSQLGEKVSAIELPESAAILHGIWYLYKWCVGYERVVFLLGDVVYSRACLNTILMDIAPLSVYGRRGPNPVTGKAASEIFGISVREESFSEFFGTIKKIWLSADKYGIAKLWTYVAWIDRPEIFVSIADYTDDVDSPEEWVQFGGKLVLAALVECVPAEVPIKVVKKKKRNKTYMDIDVICHDGSPLGVTVQSIYGEDGRIGVGGAELALLTMCEQWQLEGHHVRLYNNPKCSDGSLFEQLPVGAFNPMEDRDALIVFRSPNPMALGAKGKRIWWSTDQYTVGSFKEFSAHVDKIVTISPFHADYFSRMYGITETSVIDLPVRLIDYFLASTVTENKVPGRCIWTSVPDRGLQIMHACWPRIRQQVPNATLVITSDYRLWGVPEPRNDQWRSMYMPYVNQGVTFLGAVNRRRLVVEQMKAEVFPYTCTYDELFCVHANNYIRLDGYAKLAKDIVIGDKVLTSSGVYSPVLKVYPWVGLHDMVKIRFYGEYNSLDVTKNHKVLAIRKGECGNDPTTIKRKLRYHQRVFGCAMEWIKAGDLRNGDVLLYPFSREIVEKNSLFIDSYIDGVEVVDGKIIQIHKHVHGGITRKKTEILNEIEITHNLMSLIGYYISEGSGNGGGVIQYSLCLDEEETLAMEINKFMFSLFGVTGKNYKRGEHGLQISFCSTVLVRFFESLCGKGARNKHIPEWAMVLPLELQESMLVSLVKGDGHISKRNNSYSIRYSTSSSVLAYQVRDIFARLGIASSIQYRKSTECYTVVASGNQIISILKKFDIEWIPTRKSRNYMWIHDGLIHQPIFNISEYVYYGSVYDFTVAGEHSFVANSAVVHNCIAAAEAQVAGAFPITSPTGALATTNMGVLVDGVLTGPEWVSAFVKETVAKLTDPNLSKISRELQQNALQRFDPKKISEQWMSEVFHG